MANLISGTVVLVIALGYLGILAVRVGSLAFWIVVLIGAAMMVWSFYESLRGEETPLPSAPSARHSSAAFTPRGKRGQPSPA